MTKKPVVIIIEDNPHWLKKLSEIIEDYFDVDIEQYQLFNLAESKLINPKANFDLMITDIFPTDDSRQTKGLKFVEFVNRVKDKPVIVVTGEPTLIKTILNEYKVIDAFDKANFEKIDFINSVSKVLSPKNMAKKNKVDDGKENEDPNDFILG